MWELRETITAYDAAHVTLAERLDGPLVTGDARLARSSGSRCAFDLIEWPSPVAEEFVGKYPRVRRACWITPDTVHTVCLDEQLDITLSLWLRLRVLEHQPTHPMEGESL